MLCAVTGYATSTNLAAIRDELTKSRNVLVVNRCCVFTTESANLLLKFLYWWLSHCGAPSRARTVPEW